MSVLPNTKLHKNIKNLSSSSNKLIKFAVTKIESLMISRKLNSSTLILFLLFALQITSCKQGTYIPQSGDLLFQVNATSDFTDAIINTTGDDNAISFSHVGIVCLENNETFIIEATPNLGVQKVSLQDFLDASAHDENRNPLVIAYRLKPEIETQNPIDIATTYLGMPYDSVFLPDNNAIYCSELIYKSYLSPNGKEVFTAIPMSFSDTSGQIDPYWVQYFEKLKLTVPEGVMGTNPNDLSKDEILEYVGKL
ncbi:MAG: YiiX/YebB-like N1pC/P60 family cysteine hydrolase [Bacteroidales bacterium]|nr:YiiX/YebB-like N1pC/P60 family cysteine hydrolase [Bacteroidales bacterium]